MILTWLWKLFLAFRRSREQAVLEAPKSPAALGTSSDGGFINHSTDTNSSGAVIFERDAPAEPVARP
jgi:hypothetical protein